MRLGVMLTATRINGKGNQRIWLYKSRKPAVAKFMGLVMAQVKENEVMRQQHAAMLDKARQGDMAAMLALRNF